MDNDKIAQLKAELAELTRKPSKPAAPVSRHREPENEEQAELLATTLDMSKPAWERRRADDQLWCLQHEGYNFQEMPAELERLLWNNAGPNYPVD